MDLARAPTSMPKRAASRHRGRRPTPYEPSRPGPRRPVRFTARVPNRARRGDERPRAFSGIDRERLGIAFIVAAIVVVGLILACFALFGVSGLLVIPALLVVIGIFAFRRDEAGPVEVATNPDRVHRVLVLANEGLSGARLADALASRDDRAAAVHVRVVVPALGSALNRLTSDLDDEVGRAEVDLERIVGEVRELGVEAEGEVGDTDPGRALEDALRTYPADEVILVNPAKEDMGRLEKAATLKAHDSSPIPVSELHV